MKKHFLLLALVVLFVAGCGDAPISSNSPTSDPIESIEVPVDAKTVWAFELPSGSNVLETDNNSYWRLTDDTTIYLTSLISHTDAEYDESTGVYMNSVMTCKDFTEIGKSICITPKSSEIKKYAKILSKGDTVAKRTSLFTELEVASLPEYTDMSDDMKMYDNNLYMPFGAIETQLDIYTAELICNGANWIECWIADGTMEELQDTLVNICICNSGLDQLDSWYQDEDTLYITAGNSILAAKKLRYNEWYIYYGSSMYKDYILTGISKVHSS